MIVRGYIGTYTKKDSKGIYTFTLNTNTKQLENIALAAEVENPTYLAITDENRYLYSVAKENDKGGVAAFSLDKKDGQATPISKSLAVGSPPCHVSVNRQGNTLLSANYHKGTVELYQLNEGNGALTGNQFTAQHHGSGPDPRQGQARAHYAAFDPQEKYIIAVDLGCDTIFTYEATDDGLTEINRFAVKPGSGPRHLVFHPNGKLAYIMTEFSSEVIVLSYDQEKGTFTELQTISTISPTFAENNQGSAIHISRDGKFLYAGNRGENTIAVFEINDQTGQLALVERTPTEGNWPRDFSLDPTEQFLIVANQESDNLALFERNPNTGRLTLLYSDTFASMPVCIKFLHY